MCLISRNIFSAMVALVKADVFVYYYFSFAKLKGDVKLWREPTQWPLSHREDILLKLTAVRLALYSCSGH